MSNRRNNRYSKNNLTSWSRTIDGTGARGRSGNFDISDDRNSGGSSYRQQDSRNETTVQRTPLRGLRGNAKFGGLPINTRIGRTYKCGQIDLRNNLRNKQQLSTVNREEESFKVTIPLSDAYDMHYLMNLLKEHLDDPNIIFYNFQKVQNSNVFYVVGADHAEALRNLSRRIQTNNGQRLVILTTQAPLTCANIDNRVEAAMKATMSSLYDSAARVMNLANFRQAEEFKQQGLFITIGKANVLRTVVTIIGENTPDLLALNLRQNRMNFLEQLKPLAEKCHQLQAIDLSKNRIHSFNEINNLRDLDLVELVLEGNPFINDFPSHATYIRAVRKLFKNLKKLDNEDLPPEIGFDLGVTENLPETKGSCIPSTHSAFVYQFLEAYYKIYDTENRSGLIQAYHDNATFSFSYSKHENTASHHDMSGYRDSHNLLRLKDESFWVKFVKTGSVDIVSFLGKLPNTEHDPDSFRVDVPFCEGSLVTVVVTGTFKETFKAGKPGRSFMRTFYISPHGNGFAIINEMLVITNLSTKQVMDAKQSNAGSSSSSSSNNGRNRNAVGSLNIDNLMIDVEFNRPSTSNALNSFGAVTPVLPQQQPQPQFQLLQQQQILSPPSLQQPPQIQSPPSLQPQPIISSPPSAAAALAGGVAVTSPVAPAAAAPDGTVPPTTTLTPAMELIVLKFMEVTKMNRAFSLKCLQENGFNGDAAYAVFQKLQSMNIIPAEAFIQ